uniref:Cardiolipin synthase N-terminal domain-containing protein n=1 Tax=Aegilops tauschii subsp. strangulata TaxID=200361 RepID=A0A453NF12_AEGTS
NPKNTSLEYPLPNSSHWLLVGAHLTTMLSSSLMLTCGHAPLPPFRKPRRLTLDRTAAVTQTSASLSTFLPGRGGGAAAPRRGWAQICRDSSRPGADAAEQDRESKNDLATATVPKIGGGGGGGGGGGQLSDWITSVLLFGIWAGLMYYVLQLAPNQTPYRDTYFLQKLLNLKVDDGFRMNNVLVSLWYIMGIWPLVYSMLLLPTGRSSKSKIPVWPFLVLSCIGGAYALIPYFVLWKPPPPAIDEDEIGQWPLKFLESKLTAGVCASFSVFTFSYS